MKNYTMLKMLRNEQRGSSKLARFLQYKSCANDCSVQCDSSVAVSMTLGESPSNHPEITQKSPSNHPVLSRKWLGNCSWMNRVWKYTAMLLMVLTLGVGEMWGGAGFWNDGGIVLNFSVNGSSVSRTLNVSSQGGTTSLGTVTTGITLSSITGKTWKDGSGNICGINAYYRVKNSSGTVVYDKTGSATALPWSSNDGNNQTWQKTGINDDLLNGGLAPDTYTFECYFLATGNSSSSSGCETSFWYSNNSSNYSYTFIVPSKNLTVAGAANGNTVSGSQTGITKGTAYSISATPTTGYTFGSWSATSGSSSISIGSTSSASTTVTFSNYSNNATVTASFNETMSTVSLVASPTGKGTFTIGGAAATSTTAGVTTTRSVTAVPISGYHFVSWAVTGGASVTSTTTNPTTLSGDGSGDDATLTATFAADDVYTLTVAAGTGISAVTGTTNNIKAGNNIAITATVATGYTWSTWTKTGAGTLSTFTAGTKNQNVTVGTAGDITLTASATENMSTLTTSNHYDAGNPSYSAPSKSASSIGISTTATLTATTPSTGYTFAGWTLSSNLVVTSGDKDTDLSITVRTNGNGAAASAQANYAEDLSTPYVLNGGSAFGVDTWAQELAFTKKSGESTGSVAYLEVPITTAWEDGVNDANYYFKVVNGSTYYGLNAGGSVWNYFSNSGEQTMTTEGGMGNQIRLSANVLGTYVIKLDYTSTPKITITWPVALSIYRSNPNDATNVKDHAWSTMPTATSYRWALDLEANTTYEFKINDKGTYYDSNTDITTTVSNRTFSTGTSDTKLITKSAGRFTFTWDASAHKLTVQYPKSAYIDASPASVYTGGTTTLTGYASELGSGSHTITYEFYKGTTLTDAYKIATKDKTVSDTFQQETQDVTVEFAGNTTSQVYTIQIKEGGVVLATNTVTVYRKWDIYVHDVAGWGGMFNYMWDNGVYESWPGAECPLVDGSSSWYTVTIDAKYPKFQLNCNECTNTKRTFGGDGAYTPNISTLPAGSYWYTKFDNTGGDGHDYYTLGSITLSDPTVSLSASVANCKDITLTGNITNCGNDGSYASDMKEVYFQVGGTKNNATTISTTDGIFTKTLSSATAGATNTLQAFAENIHGTGSSSTLHYTNVTLDRQSGTTGTTAVTAVENMAMPAGATVPERTGYAFGGYFASEGGSGKQYYDASMASANNWDQTSQAKTIFAKWTAKNYTITLNQNGATTESDPTSLTATYDAKANGASDVFSLTNPERTGYTFRGWNTAADTSGTIIVTWAKYYEWNTAYVDATGHWIHDGDVEVFAMWKSNTYAVTLSTSGETGYGSSAPSNQTATYGAALPTITPPVGAAGYMFQGYFTGTGGTGTKYYNANGTSAKNWDIAEATTLHAYFQKAEISSLEHDASVAKADVAYLVVNPVLNVTPTDYTAICWTLHYTENDNEVAGANWSVASYTEGGTKPLQVRFTLNNMSVGSYYVQAVLKANATSFTPCSEGTEFDVKKGEFSIVGSSTVTIRYKELTSGADIAASSSVEIEAGGDADVVAPNIIGYTFNSWSVGAGITENSSDGSTINISSPYDGVITAFYTKKQMIYFNNTLGWDTVYVYFYSNSNYWGLSDQGTGANTTYHGGSYTGKYAGMTKMGDSNIYYYDMTANSATSYTNVAFTELDQNGSDYFYNGNKVIGRGDYSAALSMYVPLTGVEPVEKNAGYTAYYYEKGYWMNYPDNTGYTLVIYDNTGLSAPIIKQVAIPYSADKKMPMSITTDLEGGKTYGFEIKRADGNYYGNSGTMTNGHSGDDGQPVWEFTHNAGRAGLTTTSAGNYTFTLNYGLDLSSNYNYLVGVRYPESTGDFRVQYKDNVNSTWKTSVVIPAITEADTVSYFVRHSSSPYIRVQKCTATYENETTTVTWDDENSGNNILTSALLTPVTEDGVYNFIFSKSDGALVLDKVEPYTGNFYIRVDGAGSTNWDNYRAADHIMPFSEYSFAQTTNPYSHYFAQYYKTLNDDGTPAGAKNIKFVVANDYSTNVSDTIGRDGIGDNYVDADGWLSGRNANIRFMYNYKTNVATRRYLDGAQEDDSEFLLLIPSNSTSIYDAATEGNAYSQVRFTDNGNWVYEANVWVVPGTTYKLKAQFGVAPNLITQYLKGKESGDGEYETLIGGSGARLQIRLIYDFKTNRLVTGYVPSGTIDANIELNADIMFVREHQGNVTQITFGENKSITEIKNVYTTLKFNKSTITNPGLSRYERDLYYISFPYDVLVSDIIGFGTYGTHWIIEYYDGAGRAEKGFWADSKSFWKFVTPAMKSTYKLKAGTGYIVALDLDEMESTDPVWENTETVELIFPGNISSISNQEVTYNMPSHQCNIGPRFEGGDDRRIADSHWNVLGVPAYHNTTGSFANHTDEIGETSQVWSASNAPNYLYTWNMTDNSLSVTNASGYEYKAMHAYMVQYYGDVTFHTSTNAAPASVAARTYAEAPSEVQFRLEIQQNEVAVDQTFVTMSNDVQVSREFVFGEDMSKEFNKNKANIYTIVTSTIEGDATVTEVAGNTLPMSEQTTIVPVGVKIAANDDYTFSMPDGTKGVGMTLIDSYTGTHTNLSALDYTVSLEAGTYDDRFLLQISPIHTVTTDVETSDIRDQKSDVRKLLIDGLMYIVREGKMYDARGARVE